jgi:hypothetical protein
LLVAGDWRVMRRNPKVFVRGTVRHADHKTVLLDGWHEVFSNILSICLLLCVTLRSSINRNNFAGGEREEILLSMTTTQQDGDPAEDQNSRDGA